MTEPVARETFDPYHKWLGISPKDQPPHYYRLLAIDVFEPDADVISAAADKQMAFIRSFQGGKNSQLSQKLLNEIAAARICLLNAAKKAAYDRTLRARLAISEAVPADELTVVEDEPDDLGIQIPFPTQLGGSQRPPIHKKPSKKATILPLAVLGGLLVVCVVAVALVMSHKPDTQVAQADKDADAGPPRDTKPPHPKPSAHDSKPPIPADTGKPAPPENPLRPLPPNDSSHATTPTTSPGATATVPGPPGPTPPDTRSKARDDPFDDTPVTARKPETPAKPVVAEQSPKTLQELDKLFADAKTPEDYEVVAREALRAAGKAIDDHEQDAAKQLILKSLAAARKSNDAKLVRAATRAMLKPETVKEILAEQDKPDEDLPVRPRPRSPEGEPPRNLPEIAGGKGPVTLTASVEGNPRRAVLFRIGAIRQGTVITLQYQEGTWTNPATNESVNPDDASETRYRTAIFCRVAGVNLNYDFVVRQNTGSRSFRWVASKDYEVVGLRCHTVGTDQPLDGTVKYRVTITPPGQ